MLGTFTRRCPLDKEIAYLRARVDEQRVKGAPTRTRYSAEFRRRVVAIDPRRYLIEATRAALLDRAPLLPPAPPATDETPEN